jgi:hypothetical protein
MGCNTPSRCMIPTAIACWGSTMRTTRGPPGAPQGWNRCCGSLAPRTRRRRPPLSLRKRRQAACRFLRRGPSRACRTRHLR